MAYSMTMSEWVKYRDLLRSLSEEAANEFRIAVWGKGGRWNAAGLANIPRNELIEFAYALVTKYGEGSAAAACELYDEIAELSGVAVPAAIPAECPPIGDVAKALNGTIKQTANENAISGTIGRLVKQVGQDTTVQNALRDGAQVAWIPSGDTCAFCIALASRGWEDVSPAIVKAGHAEHIHANCDCAYGVRFNTSFEVKGYDPSRYLQMYEGAEGKTSQDKINSMRRMHYEANREQINEQKREAYALRTQEGN